MRYVPIVVVVPEPTLRLLGRYANAPEAVAAREPIAEMMAANGWTGEMILGGAALTQGLTS